MSVTFKGENLNVSPQNQTLKTQIKLPEIN